jgi:glycosyltransferase involved in cell wall biosynthesis
VVHPNFVSDPGPRLATPSASRRVVFVGRLSAEKGLAVALKAWKRTAPSNLTLSIAGDGPQREELRQLADGSVSFLGQLNRSDIDHLLRTSRAMLLPSLWYEVQPMSVLEALAAGMPVLGSAIGGLGETLEPLGREWQVEPGSVEAWTAALAQLESDTAVDTAGSIGRRLFETRHSPVCAEERLTSTYHQLLT